MSNQSELKPCPKCGAPPLNADKTRTKHWQCTSFKRPTGDFNQSVNCSAVERDRLSEELAALQAHADKLVEALRIVLDSAFPNKRDHPGMFEAWKIGEAALASHSARDMEERGNAMIDRAVEFCTGVKPDSARGDGPGDGETSGVSDTVLLDFLETELRRMGAGPMYWIGNGYKRGPFRAAIKSAMQEGGV